MNTRVHIPLPGPAPACPICHSADVRFFTSATDRLFGVAPGTYALHRCSGCGCVFQHPMPGDVAIAGFYPETYWWEGEPKAASRITVLLSGLEKNYREFVAMDHVRFLQHCARQARYSGRSLLDVGCGAGTFLHLAGHRGFITHGLDFSARAVSVARRQYGLDVREGDVGSNAWQGHRFDFITMFHVLEHLTEPLKALNFAISRLKPSGSLIIQVPNVDSLQARLFGERWYGLDVPRHVIDFTPRGLEQLLVDGGFTGRAISRFSLRDNPASLASSLAPSLDPIGRKGRKLKTSVLAEAMAGVGYFGLVLAALPLAYLESMLGFGATLWVHARPRGN